MSHCSMPLLKLCGSGSDQDWEDRLAKRNLHYVPLHIIGLRMPWKQRLHKQQSQQIAVVCN